MRIVSTFVVGLLILLMAKTTFAAAAEPNMSGGPGTLQNIFPLNEKMDLANFAERLVTPNLNDKSYTCRAWTTCSDGSTISCWSRGYSCYSSYIAGYRVYCSATSYSGYTRYWVYYCY
ncbi:MAG: hypothetical protein ACXVCP_19435 [Bdellovibrio sp.]